jgi:hypothetical protein
MSAGAPAHHQAPKMEPLVPVRHAPGQARLARARRAPTVARPPAAPVDAAAHELEVAHGQGREVAQPVAGVRKLHTRHRARQRRGGYRGIGQRQANIVYGVDGLAPAAHAPQHCCTRHRSIVWTTLAPSRCCCPLLPLRTAAACSLSHLCNLALRDAAHLQNVPLQPVRWGRDGAGNV